jgi:hypothetical protein
MTLYQQFTSVLLSQLPFLVVYIVVLVIAVVRRKQFPAIAVLVIVAMATFILANLTSIFITIIPALWRASLPAMPISTAYGVFSFITGVLSAAGWVFLVAAVFFDRKEPTGNSAHLPAVEQDSPAE